jgi:hypothetical protein
MITHHHREIIIHRVVIDQREAIIGSSLQRYQQSMVELFLMLMRTHSRQLDYV